MKKFFVILLTSVSLISCTKQISAPQGAASQNVFFQNANIAVKNITAKPTAANSVTVSFSTLFENNISCIELMSSTNTNTFCTKQVTNITGNSFAQKDYSFTDANAKTGTMYYLLRFKTADGNWVYSSYITVQVN